MTNCHHCNCKEGEIHQFGCDMERCPFCGGQLISCSCVNESELKTLEETGRIPYIEYPNICAKCGKLYPKMFNVPNEEWIKYIQPDMRDAVICRSCFNFIKETINLGSA